MNNCVELTIMAAMVMKRTEVILNLRMLLDGAEYLSMGTVSLDSGSL